MPFGLLIYFFKLLIQLENGVWFWILTYVLVNIIRKPSSSHRLINLGWVTSFELFNRCFPLICIIRKYDPITYLKNSNRWSRTIQASSFTYKFFNNYWLQVWLANSYLVLVYISKMPEKFTLTMPQHKTAMFQMSNMFISARMNNCLLDEYKLNSINKFSINWKMIYYKHNNS